MPLSPPSRVLVGGASPEPAVVFDETARQQQAPEELIGRATSLSTFGETALVPLAYALAGTVAHRVGTARHGDLLRRHPRRDGGPAARARGAPAAAASWPAGGMRRGRRPPSGA
ncbi:hypothetical protein [Streptomyces sp. NPDC007883]|uniref:hypothetical protein n=1 Tax=Streptomyces sp. NPDC007883 TaxID=3155116 RepID=UPI0033C93FBD